MGTTYLQTVFVLIIIIGMMAGFAWLLKRYGLSKLQNPKGKTLGVLDQIVIDHKRRLVLMRCGDKAYLTLLGPERDLLLAQDLVISDLNLASTEKEEAASS